MNINKHMSNILKYMGLKRREEMDKLCSRGFVPPPSLLKAVFDLEDIQEKDIERYRNIYKNNCKELVNKYLDRIYIKKSSIQLEEFKTSVRNTIDKSLSKAKESIKKTISKCLKKYDSLGLIRNKFIWKGSSDNNFKKFVEIMLNLAYTGVSNSCLTWSQWLILTDEGEHLINMIIKGNKVQKTYGLATLFAYLMQIYITSGYDNQIFRKELFDIVPSLEPIFEKYPFLKEPFIKGLLGSGTAIGFLKILSTAMIKWCNVPEDFFKHFSTVPIEETYEINDDEKE
jgi:hypothetical protein